MSNGNGGLEISWASLWRVLAMIALAFFVYLTFDVITALLLAIVISTAIDAPVTWLEKKKIPRILGTLAIFLIMFVILAAIVYAIVPLALSEFTNFLVNAKEFSNPIVDYFKASDFFDNIDKNLNQLTDTLISGNVSLLQLAGHFIGGVFLAISVLVLSFYLTVGKDGVEKFLTATLPSAYEDYVLDLYHRTKSKIGRWLKGQIVLSLVVGVVVFIGLWLLGVNYSLLIGILAGIFELIPFVGPIFSGATAILLASSESLSTAFYVFILFIVVQQIENHVMVPAVMRFTTALNPVVVLIAILLGGKVLGLVGLILAVPVAVFVQELVEDWTQWKVKRRGLGL
ncbi:MAG: AI-2E family transporter [Patescibacteria group bacterium]